MLSLKKSYLQLTEKQRYRLFAAFWVMFPLSIHFSGLGDAFAFGIGLLIVLAYAAAIGIGVLAIFLLAWSR